MQKKTNTSMNPTEILANQFAKIERNEINVDGLPTLYANPMTLEQQLNLGNVYKEQDPRKKALAMCKVIVDHAKTEDGEKAFLNHDNQKAHVVLATRCHPDVISTIYAQVAGFSQEDVEEAEELAKKSQEPDSA